MIKISDKSNCSGCTACASVCTHGAITMQPDALGFLYPVVDIDKCIDCGLCEKVCEFHPNYNTSDNFEKPYAYGAVHKDVNEVMRSRSGAAFAAISDYVLEQGGVVYGAGYKDHFRVAHKRATTKEERDEFRGSKYVQSDLTGVFQSVKDDLKKGLFVLFSGTPCQTAGLNAFVGKKLRDNLLLVDIVCHGVPGPYLWRDYLAYLEKKEGKRIKIVNFRDKELFGWREHHETFVFEDIRQGGVKMIYTDLFYTDLSSRKSCGKCPFANTRRPSDITLADFWGYEHINPDVDKENRGVSLVLCNTEKGWNIFKKVQSKMYIFEVTNEDYLQPNLQRPTPTHPKRDEYEKLYAQKGFIKTMEHYRFMGWQRDLDLFIARQKRRIVKYTKKLLCIK